MKLATTPAQAPRLPLLLTLAAVTLSSAALAQSPQNTWAQSYGALSYDREGQPTTDGYYGSGFDVPAGIAQMPDGGYVVAGQFDLPKFYRNADGPLHTMSNSCMAIVRYAPNGVILWQKVFRQDNDRTGETGTRQPASNKVHALRTDAQGNIFVALTKVAVPLSGVNQPLVVAKFSPDGTLLWENGMDGERRAEYPPTFVAPAGGFGGLTLTNDGGVLMALDAYDSNNASTHPVLIKFDAGGALTMYQAYDDDRQYTSVEAVAQSSDGARYAFIALGWNAIVQTDTSGNILHQQVFPPPAGHDGEALVDLIGTADGGYALLGWVSIFDKRVVLRKLGADLSLQWGKVIGRSSSGVSAFQPRNFIQTADGGFLISGASRGDGRDPAGSDAAMMKVDAEGNLEFVSVLGGHRNEGTAAAHGEPEHFVQAIRASDGGYALTSTTKSYGLDASIKPDWWIVKTDQNRRMQEFDDIMTDLPQTAFSSADETQPAASLAYFKSVVASPNLNRGASYVPEDPSQNAAPDRSQIRVQADNHFAAILPSPGDFTVTPPSVVAQGALWNFQVTQPSNALGLTVRVQRSATPGIESSWIDLPGGGLMTNQGGGVWRLSTENVPSGQQVRFRVICSEKSPTPKAASAVSQPSAAFDIGPITAPTVSISPPPRGNSGGFGTQFNDPLIVAAGTFRFGATASSARPTTLTLAYDGSTLDRFSSGSGNVEYLTNVPGDHILEAFALDDLGNPGAASPVYIRIPPLAGKLFTLVNSGDWHNAANWTDAQGNPGIPGLADHAVVGSRNVSLAQEVSVSALSLGGGSITGPGALTVTGSFAITSGQLSDVNLTIGTTGTCLLLGDTDIRMSGNVTNRGKWKVLGRGGVAGVPASSGAARGLASEASVAPEGLFDGIKAFFKNVGEFIFRPRPKPPVDVRPNPTPAPLPPHIALAAMDQGGKLITNDGGSLISQDGAGLISNDGGSFTRDGVALISQDGAGLISQDGAGLISQDGGGLISQDGGGLISQDGAGVIAIGPNAASATHSRAAAATSSAFVQTAGETNLGSRGNVIGILGDVRLDGGTLSGSGAIEGTLTNAGGFIAPGRSAGTILVDGDFAQGANGAIQLEIGGPGEEAYDRLQIGGNAALNGRLIVKTINGYTPTAGDAFAALNFGSLTGNFSSVSSNAQLAFSSDGLAIEVTGQNLPGPKLLNIATRMRVEAGDNALIGGFIVTGSAAKKVLIRALGPSLGSAGIVGSLEDPTVELVKPDRTSVFNDNWKDSQESEISATTIPPQNDRESAIVATLEPGFYTAVARGQANGAGVGLVEVYDLDQAAPSALANISTRGLVQTGENVMIGGFIVGGTTPAKILIRAIGPSLAAQGVTGALQDPELDLVDRNGNIISNDDWRATQEAEIIATTVPPTSSREAAIVATLVPDFYTAVVRGKGGTTGVALVEAYNLQ